MVAAVWMNYLHKDRKEFTEKMKKVHAMFVLGIVVPLLLLQFSCAAVKEKPAEAMPAEAVSEMPALAEVPDMEGLLGGTHEAAGISCNDCHAESPPANDVSTDTCLTCHEDYQELAASYIDPHAAHIEFSRCSDCHHAHRPSENQCLSCHSFNLPAP